MTTALEGGAAAQAASGEKLATRIPVATYRIQLNRNFTFQNARQIVDYLHLLGVSDFYASPYFQARAESTHGYDIANHNSFNPAIGSEAEYTALVDALRANGMGVLLDIVPNHMGIGEPGNTWWMDVLENGPSSLYAPFFDIDWHPLKTELEDKVLLPILGQQYGRVLEDQELQLRYEDGAFYLYYYETCLPVNPRTYTDVLKLRLPDLVERLGAENDHVLEYQSIMTGLENLPPRTETERSKVIERHREKEILKRRLAILCGASPDISAAVQQGLERMNGTAGDPRSFDLMDELIDRQAYRLSYWRVAAEEINYRRFFDVNDLAAIRMERPEVFQATHQLIMRLLAEGKITGLRLDHPDGLWDPASYFRQLQEAYLETQNAERRTQNGQGDGQAISVQHSALSAQDRPLYLLVEKILGHGETLPRDWPVHGTTGYDFMNALNGLFVDSSSERRFNEIYGDFTGLRLRFDDLVYDTRKQIMSISLASEVEVLTYAINRISEHNRYYRDFTLSSLRTALREVIACFTVYRTYIVASTDTVQERDRAVIETAIKGARRRNTAIDPSIFDFIRDILLLRYPATSDPAARDEQREFVMKFQQLTGPVMAKGLEDTAFYIYNRLTSLNEVGGEPKYFGISPSAFHRENQERLRHWPYAMLATSTHDTKRSEDVRARINVLSELPDEWRKALSTWSRLNRRKKAEVDDKPAPDRNEEYLFYQTLLGVLPDAPPDAVTHATLIERLQDYMIKAMREAKVNTSWVNPNNEHDDAVKQFVAAALNDQRFMTEVRELHRKVAHFGAFNALSQALLKLTSPGVPDIYQGNDMFDFSLVDPDNRRPVDYDLRKWLLGELVDLRGGRAKLARMLTESKDGRLKLYLTHRTLSYRRDHAELFWNGSYTPLEASGDAEPHVVAFARAQGENEAIVVVPRLLARRLREPVLPLGKEAWSDALLVLPSKVRGRRYRNVFTDETVAAVERDGVVGLPLAKVLANFPVALLASVQEETAAS